MDFWQLLKTRGKQLGVTALLALAIAAVLERYQYEYEHEERYENKRWPGYAVLEVLELKLFDERMRMRGRLPPPQERRTPVLFTPADLKGDKALVLTLREHRDPVSRYLWKRLPATIRSRLSTFTPQHDLPPGTVEAVTNVLNQAMRDPHLYSAKRFAGVKLRPDTRRLLDRHPRGDKLLVVNRLLLTDAYPRKIARDLIIILGIDHESIQQIGKWPFPRSCHARVVKRLVEAGARIIAFDVDFSGESPLPRNDQAFAEACADAGNVILAANLEEGSRDVSQRSGAGLETQLNYSQIYPLPILEDSCLGTGFISVAEDMDAFIRSTDTAFYDEAFAETLPFFGPMVAGAYQGLDDEQVGTWMQNRLRGKKKIPYLRGFRTLINYIGPVRSIATYPYYFLGMKNIPKTLDLVNTPEARRRLFQGKIVLIGGTADELQDNKPTPFFEGFKTPGVEVHANVVTMFLTQNYLRRVRSRTSAIVLVLVALITGLITVLVNRPVSRIASLLDLHLSFTVRGTRVGFYGITWFLLYLLGAMAPPVAVFGGLNVWFFGARNVVLPLGYPLVAIAATYFLGIFYMFLTEEQERKRMHGRFQRFVAPSVLTEILANPQDVPRPRKVNATIVFTDLQGFTTLSEQMEPEEVVEVLNDYLDRMTNVIFRHAGTIDKFIGDAIMVIFGAPIPQEDHPLRAVRCAVEMQAECARFRQDGRAKGWPDFFMRIGIHTDDVVVGSIGSSLRMDYTAIGDGVNLAARLEAANKQYGSWVMCSEDTLKRCGDAVDVRLLDAVTVKGKTEAVNVYEVLQLKDNGQPVGYNLRQIAIENEQSESAQKARAAYGKGIGGH